MPSQEARIDRVVDDFNLSRFDPKQFLNLVLGELRDRENSCRIFQNEAGEVKMKRALEIRAIACAVHVLKQVVHGNHVRTWQVPGQPK